MPVRRGLFPILLILTSGCAERLTRPPLPAAGDEELAGVWDLVEQRLDGEGDERIERQEWQLQRSGRDVLGFWIRSRTWVSRDGRPFACNGRGRYTESWRYLFRGRAEGRGARLEVTRSLRDPGRCEGAAPEVRECQLWPGRSGVIFADCGWGWMRLQRRLDPPVPLDLAEHRPGSLTGIWTWGLRSTDSEGDRKLEAETWHLRQHGRVLEGHYDRLVVVQSSDGRRFQCNQELSYMSRARFRVRGAVNGQRLTLEETGFSATPDPCETGYRSLDRYQGTVDDRLEVITLSWGKGAQLLYRRY